MAKQPLYPSTKGRKAKAPVTSLKQVSIKILRDHVEGKDFSRLMGAAEGLWHQVVELRGDLEKVQAKTDDHLTRIHLAEILQEVKTVESFTFNLTEY